jgi:uroporphyrinogen-III synthase
MFSTMPQLAQQTILITRSTGQSSEFQRLLTHEGATIVEMPALEIQPPSSWAGLDAAIGNLAQFDWLCLTSTNAVDYFTARLMENGKDYRDLHGIKIAVVGEKTAQSLQQRGICPDYIPPDFVADALVEHFPIDPAGQHVLFPRVESGGREVLVQALSDRGANVTEVAAYQSGCPQQADPAAIAALEQGRVNFITFASSKTVKHFCQLLRQSLGEQWATVLDPVVVASIGPQTSLTCQELLGRVDLEATEYTLPGLTQAIVEFVAQKPLR